MDVSSKRKIVIGVVVLSITAIILGSIYLKNKGKKKDITPKKTQDIIDKNNTTNQPINHSSIDVTMLISEIRMNDESGVMLVSDDLRKWYNYEMSDNEISNKLNKGEINALYFLLSSKLSGKDWDDIDKNYSDKLLEKMA